MDSKGTLVLRDFQVLREPLGPQERRGLLENQDCQEFQVLTDPRVTLARKDPTERKDIWVPQAPKAQSVIPGPEA